jgi:hypothetical protein
VKTSRLLAIMSPVIHGIVSIIIIRRSLGMWMETNQLKMLYLAQQQALIRRMERGCQKHARLHSKRKPCFRSPDSGSRSWVLDSRSWILGSFSQTGGGIFLGLSLVYFPLIEYTSSSSYYGSIKSKRHLLLSPLSSATTSRL